MRFDKLVVVITGGNSGIGRVMAMEFAGAGAELWIAARSESRGNAVVEAIRSEGGRATFRSVDLANLEAVNQFALEVGAAHDQVDVVVNNAGAGESRLGGFDSAQSDMQSLQARWDQMVGSNFASAFWITTCLAPHLRSGGSVVNISSTASIHGNYGLYGAMKAGLEGLTRSLAVDLSPKGIRVNAVSPGWIQTPATLTDPEDSQQAEWAAQTSLLGRMGAAEEISAAVQFLASEQASFITGATLVVDGGLSIIDPTANVWRESVLT
jgi:NAD(P)-dependent dehydrogenase (short-subunit alcohol dehydrogenase family)